VLNKVRIYLRMGWVDAIFPVFQKPWALLHMEPKVEPIRVYALRFELLARENLVFQYS
jgi:hypothetical protein